VPEEEADLEFPYPEELRKGENQGHIQVESDFGVGKAAFPETVMIEKVV